MTKWIEAHAATTERKVLVNVAQISSISDVSGECTGYDGMEHRYHCYIVMVGDDGVLYLNESYEAVCRWVQRQTSDSDERTGS